MWDLATLSVYLCGQKAFGKAVLEMCLAEGHNVVGVCAPLVSEHDASRPDRLRAAAEAARIPVLPSGMLSKATMPDGVDVIVAAHSHDFIGRATRLKCRVGAIGYRPSLLPLHRGRDAVRWTVRMGDRVTGGSVYWLSDNTDAGDIAAQDFCLVPPDSSPGDLWVDYLFPMGVALFMRVLRDLSRGSLVAVPQNEALATWEPSWDRPPLRRPDLVMIGGGLAGMKVSRDEAALHLQGA